MKQFTTQASEKLPWDAGVILLLVNTVRGEEERSFHVAKHRIRHPSCRPGPDNCSPHISSTADCEQKIDQKRRERES